MNIKQAAEQFEPNTMKNVSELALVPVDIELKEETRENTKGESYIIKFFELDGETYRVPFTVLKDLKTILEKKPTLKHFCVARSGSTKEDTKYTVIPLD